MKYMTRQCRLILAIVADSCGHMTADEVYREAKKSMPRIAVGTVYRNLKELSDAGVLRRIRVADAPDLFDATLTPHEHLICPICGRVEDLLAEGLEECLRKAVGSGRFSYELRISAPCSLCREKNRSSDRTTEKSVR